MPRPIDPGFLWRPRGFFLLLGGLFLVQYAMRPWLTDTVGSDDVDQLLFSQVLARGYSVEQSPLYSWLLWAIVRVLGAGNNAAALLKYGLVLLLHAGMYGAARRLIAEPRLAVLAALSPMLTYPIAWRIHEADTTGVLTGALVAGLILQTLRLADRRRLSDYLLLGLITGLGLLASAYFGFAILALWLSALAVRRYREVLWEPRLIAAAAMAALVVAPYALWLIEHDGRFLAAFDTNLRGGLVEPHLDRSLSGLKRLGVALLLAQFPFYVIFGLVFPAALGRLTEAAGAANFLGLYLAAAIALLALFVVAFGISRLQVFQIYPVFLPLPLFLFWHAQRAGVQGWQVRWMAVVLAVVFVVAAQARIQQLQIGGAFCKRCRLQAPYPEVARDLAAAGYLGGGTIVADDAYLAGNLRVQFPAARVLAARHPSFRPPASGATGQCLLVWHAEFEPRMPDRLRRFAEPVLGLSRLDQAPVAYLEAKVLGTGTPIAPRRNIRIGYVMPRGSAGPCG